MPETFVALLRGINVGGHNKLPMKDLAQIFTDLNCENVRTYIQSGNVVFQAGSQLADAIPDLVTASITDRFGYSVPVVLRTADELREVAADHPFSDVSREPRWLHVIFLQTAPAPEQLESLDPDRSPPDEFTVRDRHIFVHYPNGTARSKLDIGYFDSQLATTGTMRNWNTVLKLSKLASGTK